MERYLNLWAESLPQLLTSTVAVTIPLSLISFALALLVSRFAPVNWLAWLYIWVFRGTPLLVQLFIVFYGLPKVGLALDVWSAAIITMSLHTGAYVAETFRSAVAAIPGGQFEAAATLNFTRLQTLRYVVIPQAVRIALPNLGNNFIDLIKGTSLVSVISMVDLFQTPSSRWPCTVRSPSSTW